MKEKDYYPLIKKILLSDPRILSVFENKKIINGFRPDFVVFLKEPLILSEGTQFESRIHKCFAIEVKMTNGFGWIIKGIKQTYDKYKNQEFKGYLIEKCFFITVPFENYLYDETNFHSNIKWALKRVCWQFGIGWVDNYEGYLHFTLNEQHKFKIFFKDGN